MTRPNITALTFRHLPAAAADAPLVVVLHGRGDSMDGFAWLPGELGGDLAYLFLDAPDRFGDGWSWYPRTPNHEPGILRSRALISDALDAAVAAGTPAERVVLFGFSQGCLMAVDVALRYPRRLGAVMGFSGYVAFTDRITAERTPHASDVAWRISHGRADDMLPLSVARAGVEALCASGIPVEWREYDDTHTIGPQNMRDASAWLRGVLPTRSAAPRLS